MKIVMKKFYAAITLLSITSINPAFTEECNDSYFPEEENCCACEPTCASIFIGAEFLYWRAYENGLDTCVPRFASDVVNPDGTIVSTFRGRSREPNFEWNPGFRIGAGFQLPDTNWDFAAIWTQFHSDTQGSHHSKWKIHLDVVDILGLYEFNLTPCVTLIPFGGVRLAKINQRLHVTDFGSSAAPDLISENVENKEKFLGAGPLIGLEADWKLGCGFSLYASGAVSLLYGRFHVKINDSEAVVGSSNSFELSKHLDASQVAADAEVGVRWQTEFWMNTQLVLQVGLEHHRYFDHNRLGDYGDLSFDGINVAAGLAF